MISFSFFFDPASQFIGPHPMICPFCLTRLRAVQACTSASTLQLEERHLYLETCKRNDFKQTLAWRQERRRSGSRTKNQTNRFSLSLRPHGEGHRLRCCVGTTTSPECPPGDVSVSLTFSILVLICCFPNRPFNESRVQKLFCRECTEYLVIFSGLSAWIVKE